MPPDMPGVADPGQSVVVWRRGLLPALTRLLDPLQAQALPHLRLEHIRLADALPALREAIGERSAAMAPLLEDAAMLVACYGRLAGCVHVRLRLLCTYSGPGTEWLPSDAVRSDRAGGILEPDPGEVRRLDRFDVGFLKGMRWHGAAPAVHRSPPIAGSGLIRLLLCVDEGQCC